MRQRFSHEPQEQCWMPESEGLFTVQRWLWLHLHIAYMECVRCYGTLYVQTPNHAVHLNDEAHMAPK